MGTLRFFANKQFCHEYSEIIFINDCSFLEHDAQAQPLATMNSDLIQQMASQC
jgi:hypothetical protein